MEAIKAMFEQEMWNSYAEPLRKRHYNAHLFRQMLEDYGALGTAEKLLASEDLPYGLTKLWELGMLHLSVEALVLKPAYKAPHALFTAQQREIARRRLMLHFQYKAPWDTGD